MCSSEIKEFGKVETSTTMGKPCENGIEKDDKAEATARERLEKSTKEGL